MTGLTPQSTALAEAGAGAESITELLSRDPEGYQKQDRIRIIELFREQARKWKSAETTKHMAKTSPKVAANPKAIADMLAAEPKNMEDLGF